LGILAGATTQLVWEGLKTPLGGSVAGGVVTYGVGGKQFVATTSGNVSKVTFTNSTGSPTIVIMAVGVPPVADQQVEPVALNAPSGEASKRPDGRALYGQFCAACHGTQGEGATGPRLIGIHERLSLEAIVAQIKKPRAAMPKLYPTPLNDAEAAGVAAYAASF